MIEYTVEHETERGEIISTSQSTYLSACARARDLSNRDGINGVFVVASEHGKSIGHVLYSNGVRDAGSVEGRLK